MEPALELGGALVGVSIGLNVAHSRAPHLDAKRQHSHRHGQRREREDREHYKIERVPRIRRAAHNAGGVQSRKQAEEREARVEVRALLAGQTPASGLLFHSLPVDTEPG